MDSLIVLAKLLSSLPIILKLSIDVAWPLELWCWNIGYSNSTAPPRVWRRYVDDTWVVQQQEHQQQFLQHINTVDPSIQFTVEEAKEDGSIPFLDTVIRPEEDGSFTIGVYRKPTHTDLYLPWDSAHDIAAK